MTLSSSGSPEPLCQLEGKKKSRSWPEIPQCSNLTWFPEYGPRIPLRNLFQGVWGGGRGKKKSRAPPAPSLPSLPLFSSFSLPHPPAHSPRRRRRRSGVGGTRVCVLSRRRRASPQDPQAGGRPFFLSLALPVFLSPSLAAAPPGGLGLPRASGPPAWPR